MVMERMQILVTPEQRARLERAAKQRSTSVTAVVRDAIDNEVGRGRTREESMAALARLRAMPSVKMPPPAELRELIDSQHDENWPPRR